MLGSLIILMQRYVGKLFGYTESCRPVSAGEWTVDTESVVVTDRSSHYVSAE